MNSVLWKEQIVTLKLLKIELDLTGYHDRGWADASGKILSYFSLFLILV